MLEVLRSGRLSLGPMVERFEREFADWLGVEDAVAVSSGTAALHLGVRALGWGQGDEVLTSPFSFVASANCLLYEGARPVFCDVDPETLEPRPRRRRGRGRRAHRRDPPGPHLRLPGGDARARGDRRRAAASGCSRTPARRSARSTPRAGRSAPAATSPTFAFYANKQLTTGEGGMLVPRRRRDRRARCAASATRAARADMGWLDARPARLQLPAHRRRRRRSGSPSSSELDAMLGGARRGRRASTRSASAGVEGVERPDAPARGERAAQLVRLRGAASGRRRPRRRRSPSSPSAGSPPRPTCRASTSSRTCASSATREGEFPVAEDASRRSLALPFFPR